MTNEHIKNIIDNECNRILVTGSDATMTHGAMGVGLFLVWYGRFFGQKDLTDKGMQIISERCVNLSNCDPLDFHNGQVGITMGLLYLSHIGLIEGTIGDILKEVDDNIFKHVIKGIGYSDENHLGTLMDISTYFALRLRYDSFSKIDERIYSKLLSKIINSIFPTCYEALKKEPLPGCYSYGLPRFLTLIPLAMGNGFDNRLKQIITEIQHSTLSQIPYMVSNRMALANAISFLNKCMPLPERWMQHHYILINSIDPQNIDEEYKTNQLSIYNGIGWFALQLIINWELGNNTNKDSIDLVNHKIMQSPLLHASYEELSKQGFLGLYGILGVIYYITMLNTILNGKS